MKRALTMLAPAVLAVALIACGDDDDSPDTTSASEETTAATTAGTEGEEAGPGGSVTDDQTAAMQEVFPRLNQQQIDCLIEQVGDVSGAMDPAEVQALAETCGIDPADLEVSIPSLPADMLEQARSQFAELFPTLDEEQIDCLLTELQDGNFDPSQATQLAETCGIDPADLQPGG